MYLPFITYENENGMRSVLYFSIPAGNGGMDERYWANCPTRFVSFVLSLSFYEKKGNPPSGGVLGRQLSTIYSLFHQFSDFAFSIICYGIIHCRIVTHREISILDDGSTKKRKKLTRRREKKINGKAKKNKKIGLYSIISFLFYFLMLRT